MQDIFFDFFRCKKRGVWPQWAALSVSSKSTFLALGGGVLCLAISAPMAFFCYTTCALKCFCFFALLNHMCSMNFVTPLVPQGLCSVSTLLFLHLCSKEFRLLCYLCSIPLSSGSTWLVWSKNWRDKHFKLRGQNLMVACRECSRCGRAIHSNSD